MLLVLKLYSIQVVISLPLWIKLTMGQLLLFFPCNFCSFFSYVGGVLVTNLFSLLLIVKYILAIQQIIAFVILFLICSDLLNCLRSVGTMVMTTESGSNSLRVIFTKQFLTRATVFRCFDVCPVQSPQIFQV